MTLRKTGDKSDGRVIPETDDLTKEAAVPFTDEEREALHEENADD